VVLNLGSRRALRDDQRRNQRQWPTWPEAVRSSTCVGSVLGRKALGNTSGTRKTGLDQAMIREDASFIVAPAQRAHDTHIDHQFKIQALSNGRQPGDDLLATAVRPSWTARRTRARDDRPADAGPVRTAVRPPRWQGVIPIQRGTQESRRAAFSPSSSINGRVRLTCAPRSRSTGADRGPACGVVNSPERLFRFLVRASRDFWAFLLGEGRFPRHSHLSPEDPPERRDGSMIGRAKAWEAAPPRQTFVPHFPYCSAKSFATCERIDPLICRAEDQILLVHELGS